MTRFLLTCSGLIFLSLGTSSCSDTEMASLVTSPNGDLVVNTSQNTQGTPVYWVTYKGKTVVDTSAIGFEFKNQAALGAAMELTQANTSSFSETWEMPWGEQREVQNNYNELKLSYSETGAAPRQFDIVYRLYDDGFGFRFEFPQQEHMKEVLLTDENTEFSLTGDHQVWWQPGDWDIYEHLYSKTKFSQIDAIAKANHPNLAATYIPQNAVNTPVTMKTADGLYLSFHEADLTNYSGMTLKVDAQNMRMISELVGSERLGGKAQLTLPFNTPWRTVQIGDTAGDLIESNLLVNLNESNAIGDLSYFTPMKYVGIWWEMHIGKSTWDMEGGQYANSSNEGTGNTSRHGATTENAIRYIDFAAENGIKGLLIEGWNTGWDQWMNSTDREGIFDFMTPYPDYDFEAVMAYAKEKGVEVIMHHETSAAPRTYEKQMEEAYNFMKENDMNSVKTGYVGKIIPEGEYHHGQWMVNHYHKVLEEAAKKKIAINAHEPIKATGKRRTYPNAISREGLRGQEFNAWATDGGNPANHLPTVAFTRMLTGPIDFTPGVFNVKFDEYKTTNQINTTLAHQLALYVVIYSPIQMVADLPEHYMIDGKIHPAFQFIRDVAVDWEQTRVLDGEVGEYVVIARQEKGSDNWYVGGITDQNLRTQKLNFDFLPEGKTYTATLYTDSAAAHWNDNPTAYEIKTLRVDSSTTLDIPMAAGGGFAISIMAN